MVEYVFVLFIYHFWTRNRQILNFEHFELFFARFYSVKRAFSTKWWPGEENAPKIIFFAFLVYFYINTKYIKLDRNSENFLIFWCTLVARVSWDNMSTSFSWDNMSPGQYVALCPHYFAVQRGDILSQETYCPGSVRRHIVPGDVLSRLAINGKFWQQIVSFCNKW